jgi:hypothetical protein
MSSTLRKGVPCSLAASWWKSALLGKGRPRMVVMLGPWSTTSSEERWGGRTTRRRAQRAHSSVTVPRDQRTGNVWSQFVTKNPVSCGDASISGAPAHTFAQDPGQKHVSPDGELRLGCSRAAHTEALSHGDRVHRDTFCAARALFFNFCGGPCRGKQGTTRST